MILVLSVTAANLYNLKKEFKSTAFGFLKANYDDLQGEPEVNSYWTYGGNSKLCNADIKGKITFTKDQFEKLRTLYLPAYQQCIVGTSGSATFKASITEKVAGVVDQDTSVPEPSPWF